jgi:SAM-dependent methyltransferase
MAHCYLGGYSGIEIGASAHNSFGLATRNVDYTDSLTTAFKLAEIFQCGEAAHVDIVAQGDELPLDDLSVDFVLSSHVIEHFWDPIKALKEWMRVARRWIFIICPQPDALASDRDLPLTEWSELKARHEGHISKPEEDDHRHWSRWSSQTFFQLCQNLGLKVAEIQDPDYKVGNGFTVVIDTEASRAFQNGAECKPKIRQLYWHVAAMGGWREIVVEQLGVLWRHGFRGTIKVGFLAGVWDLGFLQRCFDAYEGISMDLIHHEACLERFEYPTLLALERDCREGLVDEVVYFHTKGASKPGDWVSQQWRWLMNADLLTRAMEPGLLSGVDVIGASFNLNLPGFHHFAGNFWAAKAEYIRDLEPLAEYRDGWATRPDRPHWLGLRFAAEFWIGSNHTPALAFSTFRDNVCLGEHHVYADNARLQQRLVKIHLPSGMVEGTASLVPTLLEGSGQSFNVSTQGFPINRRSFFKVGKRVLYWHIAALNNWRDVVVEQLRLIWLSNFRGLIKIGLLAAPFEDGFVRRCFANFPGLELEFVFHQEGLSHYEYPTLAALEADCRAGRVDEVVYFHTKGVSRPGCWTSLQWRWLMNADLLTKAGDPDLFSDQDLFGSHWCEASPGFCYFEGNFWGARADYIRRLPDLNTYRQTVRCTPGAPGWVSDRHAAELWVGTASQGVEVHGVREPGVALYRHETYASNSDLQAELLRIHAVL